MGKNILVVEDDASISAALTYAMDGDCGSHSDLLFVRWATVRISAGALKKQNIVETIRI